VADRPRRKQIAAPQRRILADLLFAEPYLVCRAKLDSRLGQELAHRRRLGVDLMGLAVRLQAYRPGLLHPNHYARLEWRLQPWRDAILRVQINASPAQRFAYRRGMSAYLVALAVQIYRQRRASPDQAQTQQDHGARNR
jgi:hypothetical protein